MMQYSGMNSIDFFLSKVPHTISPRILFQAISPTMARDAKLEKIVTQLKAKGAKLNELTLYEFTLLDEAFREGNDSLAQLLVENGATKIHNLTALELLRKKSEGKNHNLCDKLVTRNLLHNAFYLALYQRNLVMADFLLKQGVDINIGSTDFHKSPPLVNLSGRGGAKAINFLLDRNAHINARNKEGRTALMRAAGNGNIAAVKILLERGADTALKNPDGCDVFRFAVVAACSEFDDNKKRNLEEIISLILRKQHPEISDDEIQRYKENQLAQFMLSLTYEKKSAPTFVQDNLAKICHDLLPFLNLPKKSRDLLGEIFHRISRREKFRAQDGTELEIKNPNIKGHASYFLFASTQPDQVSEVYYIDGAQTDMIARVARIQHKREIAQSHPDALAEEKLRLLEKAEEQDQQTLAQGYEPKAIKIKLKPNILRAELLENMAQLSDTENYFQSFLQLAFRYAAQDEHGIITQLKTPTQPQNRGNCGWKALAILVRTILEECYGLKTELVDGKVQGEGYELFKDFKSALIEFYGNQLIDLADLENAGNPSQQSAARYVEEILKPNCERKIAANFGQENRALKLAESLKEKILRWEEKSEAAQGEGGLRKQQARTLAEATQKQH